MSRETTLTVRLSGALSDFVQANVGEDGVYESASEYVRDLIRQDRQRAEQAAFDRLHTELTQAFAAPDTAYATMAAADIIARNRR